MEEQFKDLLIQHVPIPEAAKRLGMSRRTGYDVKERLIKRGELKNIGFVSPAFYVSEVPPTGENPLYAQERWGPISAPTAPQWWADDNIDRDGVWTSSMEGEEPPQGFSRCHLANAMMGVPVIVEGDMNDLRDNHGFVYGFWPKTMVKTNDRFSQYPLDIRMKGFAVTGYYRIGKLETRTLRFNLGDVWLDPIIYPDQESIIRLFEKRMGRICALLETHGWKFGDSFEFQGGIHFAFPDHIWGDTLDRVVKMDDGQVIADHSHGKIEIELENGNTPEGLTGAQILAHAPANILSLSRKTNEITMEVIDLRSELRVLQETMCELRPIIRELVENQVVSTQVAAEQSKAIAHILETNAQLVKQAQNDVPKFPTEPKEGYL